MLSATASATSATAAATSPATAAVVVVVFFCEQTLEQQCTIDNDATATTGDNERDDRRTGGDRDRRDFSDPEYVSKLCARRATESVHAASNDATANSRTTANFGPLVDTQRQ